MNTEFESLFVAAAPSPSEVKRLQDQKAQTANKTVGVCVHVCVCVCVCV